MSTIDYLRNEIGQKIREVREQRQITQARLSELLRIDGVTLSPSAIAKIESGKRGLDLIEAAAIAENLEIRLDYLAHPDEEDAELESSLVLDRSYTAAMNLIRALNSAFAGAGAVQEFTVYRHDRIDSKLTAYLTEDELEESDNLIGETIDLLRRTRSKWVEFMVASKLATENFEDNLPDYALTPISKRKAAHGTR